MGLVADDTLRWKDDVVAESWRYRPDHRGLCYCFQSPCHGPFLCLVHDQVSRFGDVECPVSKRPSEAEEAAGGTESHSL